MGGKISHKTARASCCLHLAALLGVLLLATGAEVSQLTELEPTDKPDQYASLQERVIAADSRTHMAEVKLKFMRSEQQKTPRASTHPTRAEHNQVETRMIHALAGLEMDSRITKALRLRMAALGGHTVPVAESATSPTPSAEQAKGRERTQLRKAAEDEDIAASKVPFDRQIAANKDQKSLETKLQEKTAVANAVKKKVAQSKHSVLVAQRDVDKALTPTQVQDANAAKVLAKETLSSVEATGQQANEAAEQEVEKIEKKTDADIPPV